MISNSEEPERTGWLANFEAKTSMLFMAVIFINGFWMAKVVNDQAENPNDPVPLYVDVGEIIFLVIYTVELVLRFSVHGLYFFCNRDASWNIFDFVLVCISLYDLLLSSMLDNVAFLRTLRIAKAAKVLRIFRVVALFKELHLIWDCLFGSVRSLIWSIVMMLLIFYIFAIVFVQAVGIYLGKADLYEKEQLELMEYFGSVQRAVLTLFSVTTGGNDWEMYYWVLVPAGDIYAFVFLFFIAFSNIALLNILTGIFVENAMENAKPDRHTKALANIMEEGLQVEDLRKLVAHYDAESTGRVHVQTFFEQIPGSRLDAYLHNIGIDRAEVKKFLSAVGAADEEGKIDVDAFVDGCMRVKGGATNLDMQRLLFEVKFMHRYQAEVLEAIADTFKVTEYAENQTYQKLLLRGETTHEIESV